eukprot:7384915-Prymnesium_polylepis.2
MRRGVAVCGVAWWYAAGCDGMWRARRRGVWAWRGAPADAVDVFISAQRREVKVDHALDACTATREPGGRHVASCACRVAGSVRLVHAGRTPG